MQSLIKKELKVLIASPVASVGSALFLFLTGLVFTAQFTQASPHHLPEASLRGIVYFMAILLLFVSPLFTMRTLAEERRNGTMELLKTSPLTDWEIVCGKFVGCWIALSILLFLTIEFPIFVIFAGDPDPGPMVLSYLGLWLLGGGFLAIGIFCSALTSNQVVAAILSFVVLLTLWFLADLGGAWGEATSIITHLEGFSVGVLDAGDVAYYLLIIFVFLFLAVRTLEAERWK